VSEFELRKPLEGLTRFTRQFFDASEKFTYIGSGELGGKGRGLAFIKNVLDSKFDHEAISDIEVAVPTLTVVASDVFDAFMKRNNLYDVALSNARDDQIALAFQQAELPAELVGDFRALIASVQTPLAIRSSSLLEDSLREPFAGVYATKMVPNNQHDIDTRFRILVEAIKFVYASTFFQSAKRYFKAAREEIRDEKMCVVIQEVVGSRFDDRFYPHVSGVARSYNFYPAGHAVPEDGVVNLALGLGKTIVEGGRSWIYSPPYPETYPPHDSVSELLKQTQTTFWAVNMGKPPAHDPIKETEYMVKGDLQDAERDGTLKYVASTYNPERDRVIVGVGTKGPRVLTIAPALAVHEIPINEVVKTLLTLCEEAVGGEVEIEFAAVLDRKKEKPARFGLLQVRPMFVSEGKIEVAAEELQKDGILVASEQVMGNGVVESITDVVYIKPETFDAKNTRMIAQQLSLINKELVAADRQYLLITFGRLGTQDPWLGVPLDWAQIAGAKIVVEATLPNMDVDLSQGAHFFHNVISFDVFYFCIHHSGKYPINWEWFGKQPIVAETEFVRHIRLPSPLKVRVDGRNRRGVILP
jgi:hypothetical protein